MVARAPFGSRMATAVSSRGPLCVGIDPHPELLDAWGLARDANGLEWFASRCVEALAGEVAVVKPQCAFFEAYGSKGIAVLERVCATAMEAGALVIADAKRGDVGSTMSAYAEAFLGADAPLACDAVTVSPYLGFGALEPAVTAAERNGRGVIVLALTSNPEGRDLQHAATESGQSVAQSIVNAASERNATHCAETGAQLGPVGVVVGATVGQSELELSELRGTILAPGFGAQGAGIDDLRKVFGNALRDVLPTTSRAVLRAGPNAESLRAAALRTRDEIVAGTADH
ncbi:orotidine-5'-phosphate decarboxylase [Tamaricihabitans halophyticus]|uniref:Orotidine 5'-phosphate decarboxylase n=1 Tax=Tamaricihabitans halophyticus TaxID=1262583 RepID=A0A4V2SSD3_9PSEU|nr:orotidine-5'-phosphate decarboxylase [Tamaricihabitans halophyticus]TCP46256.1 orotidine-5'-phosphate decarboxylase [Tamaricihabitans halophyticus]